MTCIALECLCLVLGGLQPYRIHRVRFFTSLFKRPTHAIFFSGRELLTLVQDNCTTTVPL